MRCQDSSAGSALGTVKIFDHNIDNIINFKSEEITIDQTQYGRAQCSGSTDQK